MKMDMINTIEWRLMKAKSVKAQTEHMYRHVLNATIKNENLNKIK